MPTYKAEKIKKPEIPALLFPPILEVIFEIRWELQVLDANQGRFKDPSYPMMYGRLYERLQKDFPTIEDLPTVQMHPEVNPFVVRHRLRKETNGYPLIQVGPGILTLNEGKGYRWNSFRSLVTRLIESITELYPDQNHPLNFIKAELRYVNGMRFDVVKDQPLSFLADKLHMKVEPPSTLFDGTIDPQPHTVNVSLAYPLKKPIGHVALNANLGQLDGKNAYLMQTVIQSNGETTPTDLDAFEIWLKDAHYTAGHCFQTLCQGELMEKFGGVQNG